MAIKRKASATRKPATKGAEFKKRSAAAKKAAVTRKKNAAKKSKK